jgi:RNA polymerase sigma-70 factor (ECF subfamily)
VAHDPLADPEPLIRRVYSYVAYRIGDGPDAEDVTSTTIERAIRYRNRFDPSKGKAQSWLMGIARNCVDDYLRERMLQLAEVPDQAASGELEHDSLLRLSVSAAVAALDPHDRDLVALRYGAELSSRQIGQLLEMETNAVDVALHRARARLRAHLESRGIRGRARMKSPTDPAVEGLL